MIRTLTARRLAAVAAPVLLAASLSACGGGASGAPEDASKEDFCGAYNDESTFEDIDIDASPEDQAKQFKDAFQKTTDKLKEVGTPEDIPDDAREGFEIYIDAVDDLDEDDIKKAIEDDDFDNLGEVSEDDKKKGDTFTDWASDYCG